MLEENNGGTIRMKKIAVVGLYAIKNAGDNILCEATQYLIRQIEPEVSIVEVDVNPRLSTFRKIDAIQVMASKAMIKLSSYLFSYGNHSKFRYRYEYLMWWLKINKRFRKDLAGVDAIVFAGGGFLKFRTQGLNYYVEQIIKIAEKNNIPVMMNGVGIEGYDENDIRCQRLKKAINKDCVKVITTRDDVDTLKNLYIENPNILTARVGDPALWVPECYSLKREGHNDTIGINLIRGRVFQAYGNTLSEFELLNFYKKLITAIEEKGWNWVLFSNGMKADQAFGNKLLKALECDDPHKMLPAPKNTMEFLQLIRKFKCVFGARLHACITAYALDVPVVGLIWSEKLQIFAEVINKKGNFFSEEKLHIETVINAMEKSFEDEYDVAHRDELKRLTKEYLEKFLAGMNK